MNYVLTRGKGKLKDILVVWRQDTQPTGPYYCERILHDWCKFTEEILAQRFIFQAGIAEPVDMMHQMRSKYQHETPFSFYDDEEIETEPCEYKSRLSDLYEVLFESANINEILEKAALEVI